MVEVILDEENSFGDLDNFTCLVDGVPADRILCVRDFSWTIEDGPLRFRLRVNGRSDLERLINRKEREFAPYISKVSGSDVCNWLGHANSVEFVNEMESIDGPSGGLHDAFYWKINFDTGNWKRGWSVAEYRSEISMILDPLGYEVEEAENELSPGQVSIFHRTKNIPHSVVLLDILANVEPILREAHENAIQDLEERAFVGTMTARFNFPEELAVPCEQYLQYFVQFLKDVGVDASTELRHDGTGNVLFAVTPKDKNIALEMIREALDAYLGVATLPVSQSYSFIPTGTIEEQRLNSQIIHLHGQTQLAYAVLLAKDAEIAAKQSHIEYLEATLRPAAPISTLQPVENPARGEIFSGMVQRLDTKIVEVNFRRLFEGVKRLFAKYKQDNNDDTSAA